MTRSVLVTGGNGFVGSWLCRGLLAEGDRVAVLERGGSNRGGLALHGIADEVDRVRGDLGDGESIRGAIGQHGVDTVFHLAAQTLVGVAHRSPVATFEANVRGTWILLEACREHDVERVVVASSDKVYGEQEALPYREDLALRATYPYDVSKAAADLISRGYWHTYGLPVAVTRFANLYGGGDLNFSRIVPEAVCAALDGRAPVIRSDGSPERDYFYVEDAVAAYLAIAGALDEGPARGEAFNAGGDRARSVLEVVETICRLAGTDVEPDVRGEGSPAGEIDRQYVDSTKIRETCGWRQEVGLEEGLGRTIEWYRQHPEVRP